MTKQISNLKVGIQMSLGFGLVLFLTLIAGVTALINMNNLSNITFKLYHHPFAVNTTILRIESGVAKMLRSVRDAALAADRTSMEAALTAVDEENVKVLADFEIITERFLGNKDRMENARKLFLQWKPIRTEIIQQIREGKNQTAIEIIRGKAAEHVRELTKEIDYIKEFSAAKAVTFVEDARAAGRKALYVTILIIVAAIAAGMIVAFILSRAISRALKETVHVAEAMSEGDMTRRVNIQSENEIGNLAASLNLSLENISRMLAEIREYAMIVASSSEELSSVSAQMASGSEQMTTQSETVAVTTEQMSVNISTMASAAEEMSVNISSVSSGAGQMSQNMNAVASAVEEMSVSIQEIARSAKESTKVAGQASSLSEKAGSAMHTLGEAAREIGKVTDVIKRIAEQTNLLALNATIEAASAGDAGRGFAVVANEIKELANQSARAAEDIAKRISGVQKNTEQAVKIIADVSEIIVTINDSVNLISTAVEQQRMTANEISSNVSQANSNANVLANSVQEVAKGANDMARNAGEAAKGANEVAVNIHGVSQAAADASSSARQVKTSSEELAGIAGELQKMVGKFKLADD